MVKLEGVNQLDVRHLSVPGEAQGRRIRLTYWVLQVSHLERPLLAWSRHEVLQGHQHVPKCLTELENKVISNMELVTHQVGHLSSVQ